MWAKPGRMAQQRSCLPHASTSHWLSSDEQQLYAMELPHAKGLTKYLTKQTRTMTKTYTNIPKRKEWTHNTNITNYAGFAYSNKRQPQEKSPVGLGVVAHAWNPSNWGAWGGIIFVGLTSLPCNEALSQKENKQTAKKAARLLVNTNTKITGGKRSKLSS